jgi:uncharacterized membrane protein
MAQDAEQLLARWLQAGLIDADTAARIRAFEATHAQPTRPPISWSLVIALTLGGITLGSGILLFIAANWQELSPTARMALVLFMVGGLHSAGAAFAQRYPIFSLTLHTLGTISLGAGIALTGQIYHLSSHWPAAILIWALGAAVGYGCLSQWPQLLLCAILFPAWLCSEWVEYTSGFRLGFFLPCSFLLTTLSFAYLGAVPGAATARRGLVWIGALALIPSVVAMVAESGNRMPSWSDQLPGWLLATPVALLAAHLTGRRLPRANAFPILIAFAWTGTLALLVANQAGGLLKTAWVALGCVALTAWGVREFRPERINLGLACFAITVLYFYFSEIMDKLGRSLSLVLIGILFLGGGWFLERTRRRLMREMQSSRLDNLEQSR